jgi:GTP-binding protein
LVVLNKIDLLMSGKDPGAAVSETRSRLHFTPEVPVVPVSALTGAGTDRVLQQLDQLAGECARRIPTSVLNTALEKAVRGRSPSSRDRIPRLYYITQTGTFPPSFVVFTNGALIDTPYRRYLARQLRESLGYHFAPVALRFRERT